MPLGHALFLGYLALATLAAVTRPTRRGNRARYLLAVAVNEVPHLFALALALATLGAWASGDLTGAGGVVALVLAVLVAAFVGLVGFASPCVLPLVPGYLSYVTGLAGETGAGTAAGGEGTASPQAGRIGGRGLRMICAGRSGLSFASCRIFRLTGEKSGAERPIGQLRRCLGASAVAERDYTRRTRPRELRSGPRRTSR